MGREGILTCSGAMEYWRWDENATGGAPSERRSLFASPNLALGECNIFLQVPVVGYWILKHFLGCIPTTVKRSQRNAEQWNSQGMLIFINWLGMFKNTIRTFIMWNFCLITVMIVFCWGVSWHISNPQRTSGALVMEQLNLVLETGTRVPCLLTPVYNECSQQCAEVLVFSRAPSRCSKAAFITSSVNSLPLPPSVTFWLCHQHLAKSVCLFATVRLSRMLLSFTLTLRKWGAERTCFS